MAEPTVEQWREWIEQPCSKAFLRKLISMHRKHEKTWCSIPDEGDFRQAQAEYRTTGGLLDFLKGGAKQNLRTICTGAGIDPDQLPG